MRLVLLLTLRLPFGSVIALVCSVGDVLAVFQVPSDAQIALAVLQAERDALMTVEVSAPSLEQDIQLEAHKGMWQLGHPTADMVYEHSGFERPYGSTANLG